PEPTCVPTAACSPGSRSRPPLSPIPSQTLLSGPFVPTSACLAQPEVRPMPMSTEKFLVTGAAGCIGAWAVRLLLDEGVPVVATDLSGDLRRFELISQGRGGGRPEFAELDVTSGPGVAALVAGHGITHVVHLAGLQLP